VTDTETLIRRRTSRAWLLWAAATVACGASQGPHRDRAAHVERARGCAIQVFMSAPPLRTDNIGPVRASCDREDPDDVCLRELEDQACLLGGDVLWQIEGPAPAGDKKQFTGRAAHTLP
jgi:hypothetical protein